MPSGVHVFAVLLHAHLAGRAIRTRHFRQQVELQPLASDDQFDFNFQEFQPLSQERIILPVSQNPFHFHNLHCSIWGWNWCVALITRYSEPHSLLYSFLENQKIGSLYCAFISHSLVLVKLNMTFTPTKFFTLFSGFRDYSWGIGSIVVEKNRAIIIICSSVHFKHFVLPKSGVINSTCKQGTLCICKTGVYLKGPTGERWWIVTCSILI